MNGSLAALLAVSMAADTTELAPLTVFSRINEPAQVALSHTVLEPDQQGEKVITHPNELFDSVPGVWVSRGSGQEHLTAIRSPVLTGAGACAAFLLSEDGVPIRPAGLCNVNNLLELNLAQAEQVEVLRGPGLVTHGSNALHGVINAVTQAANPSDQFGVVLGSDNYRQLNARIGHPRWAVYGQWTDAGSFRADEAYRHGLLNLRYEASVESRFADFTTLSAARLDQQTAGFIVGRDAYRDPVLRRQNLNPEAFREASALRLASHFRHRLSTDTELAWVAYARHSQMEFLQHFLPGTPLEENAQHSLGIQFDGSTQINAGHWLYGLDAEWMQAEVSEIQADPITAGSAFLRETRPAGVHYDFQVAGQSLSGFAQYRHALSERHWWQAGLRAEWIRYDYDNRARDGNTREDGSECGFGGCLFSRPADRTDSFTHWSPAFTWGYQLRPQSLLYMRWAHGFRAPQINELYRLQRAQQIADIGAEKMRSIEFGLRYANWHVVAYRARKGNVILRDAEGFNIAAGETSHRGLEVSGKMAISPNWSIELAGNWARHEYEFTRAAALGESIRAGNEIDTAPRWSGRVSSAWQLSPVTAITLAYDYLGSYYLDAANTERYPGHGLFDLRFEQDLTQDWRLGVSLRNVLNQRYAERADFAFGNLRYFPGAGRQLLLSLDWRGAP